MPVPKKVLNFLDKNKVKYKILEHRKVYTAIDKARTLKIKEGLVGKTVILKADKESLIALMSGDRIIDIPKIKKILSDYRKKQDKNSVKKIDFAKEKWIKENLKGAKEGTIPPFGVLWKLATVADASFLKNKKSILNSGDHRCSIEMEPSSLKKIMPNLIVGVFTKKKVFKKPRKAKVKSKKKIRTRVSRKKKSKQRS